MPEFLVLAIGAAIAIVIVVLVARYEKVRRERLATFARENGYEFYPDGDPSGAPPPGCSFSLFGSGISHWFERFEGFRPFGVGGSRRATNLFVKSERGRTWYFFDYQYTTGSGKHQTTHHFWIAAVEMSCMIPGLTIRSEGFFDKVGALVGFRDIDFESEEFNERFHVRSDDERFAHDIVHPQMMEYLMGSHDTEWQLSGRHLLIVQGGTLDASYLEPTRSMMEGFLERVPEYVWKDYRIQGAY